MPRRQKSGEVPGGRGSPTSPTAAARRQSATDDGPSAAPRLQDVVAEGQPRLSRTTVHEVRVTYLEDGPFHFSAAITRDYKRFIKKLDNLLEAEELRKPANAMMPGALVLARSHESGHLHRSVVTKVLEKECHVHFIDEGGDYSVSEVFQMPATVAQLAPALSHQLCMTDVKRGSIPEADKRAFARLIKRNKNVRVEITNDDSGGFLQYCKVFVGEHNVRDMLLPLYEEHKNLRDDDLVYVSYVQDLNEFYVMLATEAYARQNISEQLAAYCCDQPRLEDVSVLRDEGPAAVYRPNGEPEWRRVRTLTWIGDTVYVYYVDYGESDTVSIGDLCLLPSEFVWKWPPLAIECCLPECEEVRSCESLVAKFRDIVEPGPFKVKTYYNAEQQRSHFCCDLFDGDGRSVARMTRAAREELTDHLVFSCEALERRRFANLRSIDQDAILARDDLVGGLLCLIKGTVFLPGAHTKITKPEETATPQKRFAESGTNPVEELLEEKGDHKKHFWKYRTSYPQCCGDMPEQEELLESGDDASPKRDASVEEDPKRPPLKSGDDASQKRDAPVEEDPEKPPLKSGDDVSQKRDASVEEDPKKPPLKSGDDASQKRAAVASVEEDPKTPPLKSGDDASQKRDIPVEEDPEKPPLKSGDDASQKRDTSVEEDDKKPPLKSGDDASQNRDASVEEDPKKPPLESGDDASQNRDASVEEDPKQPPLESGDDASQKHDASVEVDPKKPPLESGDEDSQKRDASVEEDPKRPPLNSGDDASQKRDASVEEDPKKPPLESGDDASQKRAAVASLEEDPKKPPLKSDADEPVKEEDFTQISVEDRCVHKNWKARVSGYEAAANLFWLIDDRKSPKWDVFQPIVKNFVVEDVPAAQEKGLDAVLAFVENCGSAERTANDVLNGLIQKSIAKLKVKTKDLAFKICLMYIEIGKHEVVFEELLKGTENKNPEVSQACIQVLTQALREFGPYVVDFDKMIPLAASSIGDRDPGVRDAARELLAEVHRWIGDKLQPKLSDLKPSQLTELEGVFITGKRAAEPTRFLKTQKGKEMQMRAAAAAGAAQEERPEGVPGAGKQEKSDEGVEGEGGPTEYEVHDHCLDKNWKTRIIGYDAAAKLFNTIDRDSPKWEKFIPLMPQFVVDSNAPAQEKGLVAVLAFVEHCGSAGRTAAEVLIGSIQKCIAAPKPRTRELGVKICLAYMESGNHDVVADELFQGVENKNLKISLACVQILNQGLRKYGEKVISVDRIMGRVIPLLPFRDQAFRDAVKEMLVEAYRWFGDDLKGQLSATLKPSQMKELEEEMAKVKVVPKTLPKSPKSGQAKESRPGAKKETPAGAAPTSQADDEEAAAEGEVVESQQDIMSSMPPRFSVQLKSKKWTERRDVLEQIEKAVCSSSVPETGNCSQVIIAAMEVISSDANVICVVIAVKIVSGLAKRLVKNVFQPYAVPLMQAVFEKCKDKKTNVLSALRDAADDIYDASSLDQLKGAINEYLNKHLNELVRREVAASLERFFARSSTAEFRKMAKTAGLEVVMKALSMALNDRHHIVREAAGRAIAAAILVVGLGFLSSYLTDINQKNMERVRQYCDVVTLTPKKPRGSEGPSEETQPESGEAQKPTEPAAVSKIHKEAIGRILTREMTGYDGSESYEKSLSDELDKLLPTYDKTLVVEMVLTHPVVTSNPKLLRKALEWVFTTVSTDEDYMWDFDFLVKCGQKAVENDETKTAGLAVMGLKQDDDDSVYYRPSTHKMDRPSGEYETEYETAFEDDDQ